MDRDCRRFPDGLALVAPESRPFAPRLAFVVIFQLRFSGHRAARKSPSQACSMATPP